MTRPNILLITTDQHRADCLGLEHHAVLQTPNLDFIGASGTRFTRAYSEAPSCIPARRTIMAGQAPFAHGMVGFQNAVAWSPTHTLAGELSKAGYQCEMVGKMHLWPQRKRYGFHRLALADSTRGANNDYLDWLAGAAPADRWAMAHGASPNGWIARPSHLPESETHSFWCVSEAIQLIEKRDPELPFFLYVSFIDPHPPVTPPQFYYDRYADQELPEPVIGDWVTSEEAVKAGQDPEGGESRGNLAISSAAMHYFRAGYYGLINHVDNQVGRLLQYLRDSKLIDETFVLFTSDHGEMLGDHRMLAKCNAFEGSARIPLLIRPPGAAALPADNVVDVPVGLQDLMPTILDIADAPQPDTMTGSSMLPLVGSRSPDTADWRTALHGEHAPIYSGDYGMQFLVTVDTKYVWHTQSGREFLFDLSADPEERRNLAECADSARQRQLGVWRSRLVEVLRGRLEGFVEGDRLVPGRRHPALVDTPVPSGP